MNTLPAAQRVSFLLLFFLGVNSSIQALSLYYVDNTASGANNGTSWANAYPTLQDALAVATATDIIWVAEGSYYPDEGAGQLNGDRSSTFQLIEDVEIYGGFPNGVSDPGFPDRDPDAYPTISGDLNLSGGSPAINVGDNTANSETTDLAGNTRIQNITIDLGAYEFIFVTFAGLYPTLDPNGDENNNGVSNYGDYAAGGDPTTPDDPSLQLQINDTQLTFSYRNNASDVFVQFKQSTDLEIWVEMIEGTHYSNIPVQLIDGVQTLITLDLLTTNPMLFFREEFYQDAP